MKLWLVGELIERERNPWEMNGRSGVAYSLFVLASKKDAPVRVRCTEAQYAAAEGVMGQAAEYPVEVQALRQDTADGRVEAVMKVRLDASFDLAFGSSPVLAAVAGS